MTQSAVCKGNVKWNISVPSKFDEEIRFFLASQGGMKITIYSHDDSHPFGHPNSQTFGQ